MARGNLCIEYTKKKNGEKLDKPLIHELKTISVNEHSNGEHFFSYSIDKRLYEILFMPEGIAVYVKEDTSNPEAKPRRVYATEEDLIEQKMIEALGTKQP